MVARTHRNACPVAYAVASLALIVALPSATADDSQVVDLRGIRLLDVAGQRHVLGDGARRAGIVVVFISSECPISRRYVPELNRLSKAAPTSTVEFYGVLSDPSVSRQEAAEFVHAFEIEFPVLFDASGELAAILEPRCVPEAYLVRASGEVVYRGRIDDVYADVDKRRTKPRSKDLLLAMMALADGREVETRRTKPVGCPFETAGAQGDQHVTYTRDIAPVLFAHCAECHRPGEVAPFPLLRYQDAAKRSAWLARVTSNRLMPPWRAADGHGEFLDFRRLSDRQIELIAAWAEAGAPEGDPAELPPRPVFTKGWRLGEPDAIVTAPVSFSVPADGPDIFQHYVVPIDIDRDETIVGFEFHPGTPSVVHHAVVLLDASGRSRERDGRTPEPGWTSSGSVDASFTSMLGVWTPGMTPRLFANNTGIPLEKDTDLVVQLHLHPSGKAETDQSKVGLYFAREPVTSTMSRNPLVMGTLIIDAPPGASRYRVASSLVLPSPITFTSVFPHMHLIGKEMKVTATLPDGGTESLIWIKDWSFYWQDTYVYREPVRLPAGTRVDVESYYDNSADNPFNPNSPPRPVRFGNDSTDEMCFAIFQTMDDEPGARRRIGLAQMQRLLFDFATAELSPEARAHIISEATKFIGEDSGRQIQRLLQPDATDARRRSSESAPSAESGVSSE